MYPSTPYLGQGFETLYYAADVLLCSMHVNSSQTQLSIISRLETPHGSLYDYLSAKLLNEEY